MTNELFPHPHDDESSEDPFTGPADPYSDQALGASPVNPVAAATQPKRRLAVFAIAGSIALLFFVFLFSSRGSKDAFDQPIVTGQVDVPAQAAPPSEATEQDIEDLRPSPTPVIDRNQRRNADFLDPSQLGGALPPGGYPQPSVPQPPSPPASAQPGTSLAPSSVQAPLWPDPGVGSQPPAQQGHIPAGSPAAGVPGALTEDELERQARLDAAREAAERARAEAEARAEWIKAEEARLRSSRTRIAEASGNLGAAHGAAAPAGPNRFGLDQEFAEEVSASSTSVAERMGITPGTRVGATLLSEFISDAQGGGRVEARLNEPLRSLGQILLPAGTLAYGSARSSVPAPGRQARVQLSFDVFVTPSGQVLRNVTGHAADPETLAMSIPGKVDHRYAERIARGALSTAVDLALTHNLNDRRSVFEAPSVSDMAMDDARRRVHALINGPIGDETSIPPAVKLESGTTFILVFGL